MILPANRATLIESHPTSHKLIQGDARNLSFIADESVHLAVTSPPYWTLKRYNDSEGQLGHWADYEDFILQLQKVWCEVFRILVPGGRLVCVVGDGTRCRAPDGFKRPRVSIKFCMRRREFLLSDQ